MFTDREHKPAMDTGAVQPFAQNLSLTSQRHLSTRVLGSRQVVNNSHLCVCECGSEFVHFISVNGKVLCSYSAFCVLHSRMFTGCKCNVCVCMCLCM